MVKIGIIGGSGLDNPEILKESYVKEVYITYRKNYERSRFNAGRCLYCQLRA